MEYGVFNDKNEIIAETIDREHAEIIRAAFAAHYGVGFYIEKADYQP